MKIIPPQDLPSKKGIDFCNVYRHELEQKGKFPKRVRLGVKKYGYLESEIDDWLKQRAAMRDAAKPHEAA